MTKRRERKAPAVDPGGFPTLREFLRAYLHEDFADEFGSAVGAAAAFLRDASAEELAALRADAAPFRERTSALLLGDTRRLLAEGFGCAWRPGSRKEVDAVLAVLLDETRGPSD